MNLERILEIIASEEELDGSITDPIFLELQTREGAEMVLKAVVQATKKSLSERFTAAFDELGNHQPS